jgi:DUF3047 family protein
LIDRRTFLLSTAATLLAGNWAPARAQEQGVIEDWSGVTLGARGVPPPWQKYETLGGHAAYDFTVVSDEGRRALDMKAAGDHSTIARDVHIDLAASPVLAWQWKVVSLPQGADLRDRARSDASGYPIVAWPRFPALLRSRLIGYVWDPALPVGTIVPSRKVSTVTFVVVRSGLAGLGQWALQARDVDEDYRTIYGEAPPSPHAIALSIDTNDTRSTAETLFGRIAFIPR